MVTPPVSTAPVPTAPTPKLGLVEVEFTGGGGQPLQAQLVQPVTAQSLTDRSCVVLGTVSARNSADLAGKRYMQATFPVTNNCAADLTNLTYVAVRRLGANATLEGSAVSALKTFGGTNAAATLASQILPTQPVYLTGSRLNVNQSGASLQVFDDNPGGELDSLQAQVDASGTTYDLLPYGFVATSQAGSRVIPAGETGEVTFALSVPIQATPAEDVFNFRVLMSAATNSVTSVTQGLEEQDAAGKVAVEARAAALPGAQIRTLIGPNLTAAAATPNSVALCSLRIAGPRTAPSATLVDSRGQVTLTVTSTTQASVVGGTQYQPTVNTTINGQPVPVTTTLRSLTPATLSVTSNLVHPVPSWPPARQTGTVEVSACGATATATLNTTPFIPVASGVLHSLAIKEDRTVVAWGSNERGETSVPAGLTDILGVAGGEYYSLALKGNGTVVGWGSNDYGTTSIPAGLSDVVSLSAGSYHSLALKADGTVRAWGMNVAGSTQVPAGLNDVVAVATGYLHNLALKADGTVVAWGWNNMGQSSVPVGLKNVIAVSAGYDYSWALKADGTVVGWGDNDFGWLNVPASAAADLVSVKAAAYHTMALKPDGTVVAWGDNGVGQVNVPADLTDVVGVFPGYYFSTALKADGTLRMWGDNSYGEVNVPAGLKVLLP